MHMRNGFVTDLNDDEEFIVKCYSYLVSSYKYRHVLLRSILFGYVAVSEELI